MNLIIEPTLVNYLSLVAINWVFLTLITGILHLEVTYRNRIIKKPIYKLDRFLCLYCISFWSILIITQNIQIASMTALMAYLLDKYVLTNKTIKL